MSVFVGLLRYKSENIQKVIRRQIKWSLYFGHMPIRVMWFALIREGVEFFRCKLLVSLFLEFVP